MAGAAQERHPRDSPRPGRPPRSRPRQPRHDAHRAERAEFIDGLLGVLRDPGLPDQVIAYAVDILPVYATATAYDESLYTAKELPDHGAQYIDELRAYWQSLPVDRFPNLVAMPSR